MRRPHHIAFACGGLAANLYPGLAIAAHVVERLPEALVTFIGTGKSLRHTVYSAGFRFANLPSQPQPATALEAVRFVTDNVAGYWASSWFLREQHVSLVVGMGGYASAATTRAAIARGVPTVLLEQNAVPGRTTRWLAPSAATVCLGFAEAQAHLPSHVTRTLTGNPARPAFEQLYRQSQSRLRVYDGETNAATDEASVKPRRLVVIGGAGGARSLNESTPDALRRLGQALQDWQVVHQSGEGQLQETIDRYRQAGVDAVVVTIIDEMASVMFNADLVVCRAAGTTLAELALAGVPAVLVPHPLAADAHQMANAEIVAASGAATIIDETNLPNALDSVLADRLRPLLVDDERRHTMAANIRRLARPDAAQKITDAICDVLAVKSSRLAA